MALAYQCLATQPLFNVTTTGNYTDKEVTAPLVLGSQCGYKGRVGVIGTGSHTTTRSNVTVTSKGGIWLEVFQLHGFLFEWIPNALLSLNARQGKALATPTGFFKLSTVMELLNTKTNEVTPIQTAECTKKVKSVVQLTNRDAVSRAVGLPPGRYYFSWGLHVEVEAWWVASWPIVVTTASIQLNPLVYQITSGDPW